MKVFFRNVELKRHRNKVVIALFSLLIIAALTDLLVWTAQAQEQEDKSTGFNTVFGFVHVTVPECLAFIDAESHLNKVWDIENSEDKDEYTVQRDEIATADFVYWYKNMGRQELRKSGEACIVAVTRREGSISGLAERAYVADVRRENAELFMHEIAREYGLGELWIDEKDHLPGVLPLD